MSIAALVEAIGAEQTQNHELGRQLQAASEARIKALADRIEARGLMRSRMAESWAQEDLDDLTEIEAEKQRAAAAAAEIEARHAALNAILEGPRDTDKAAA